MSMTCEATPLNFEWNQKEGLSPNLVTCDSHKYRVVRASHAKVGPNSLRLCAVGGDQDIKPVWQVAINLEHDEFRGLKDSIMIRENQCREVI